MPLDRCPKWDEYRPILLKVALAMSITLSIAVINISATVIEEPLPPVEIEEIFVIEDAPRTKHEKKKLPIVKPKNPEIHKKAIKSFLIESIETVENTPDNMDTISFEEPEETNAFEGNTGSTESAPIVAPEIPEESNEPLIFVEHMPSFGDCQLESPAERKSCSDKALLTYLSRNIKYPTLAREANIKGNVVIRFVIDKSGDVRDIELIRDIGGGCGAEAQKVITNMPSWSPGKQNGRPVNVYYTLPIKFSLQG